MKKLLLICVAVLPLFFASCEKDNNDSLKGTTWMTTGFSYIMGPLLGMYNHFYQFNGDGSGIEWWTDKYGNKRDMEEITYTFDYPTLIVYDSDGDDTDHVFVSKYKFCTVTTEGTPNESVAYTMQ